MLEREKIMGVLARARQMDPECQMFGASKHQYRLNLPIEASFVRSVEAEYGFSLPEDYFRFITEIGDGGAGPDYGIGQKPWGRAVSGGVSPQSGAALRALAHEAGGCGRICGCHKRGLCPKSGKVFYLL